MMYKQRRGMLLENYDNPYLHVSRDFFVFLTVEKDGLVNFHCTDVLGLRKQLR